MKRLFVITKNIQGKDVDIVASTDEKLINSIYIRKYNDLYKINTRNYTNQIKYFVIENDDGYILNQTPYDSLKETKSYIQKCADSGTDDFNANMNCRICKYQRFILDDGRRIFIKLLEIPFELSGNTIKYHKTKKCM